MDIAVPLLCFSLIGVVVLRLMVRAVRSDERAWLFRVLLTAFGLRLMAATMFALIPETRIFHEDADGYEYVGLMIERSWRLAGSPIPIGNAHDQNYGYPYVCATGYWLFGDFRPVPSYFNALLGSITVALVYRLARRFFHGVVARRSALLTAFIPSMILWNSLALKDTLVTFFIVLALSSCVRLKQKVGLRPLALTLLPIVAIQPLRFYMVYFVLLAVIGSLVIERSLKVVTGVPKLLLIAVGGLLLLTAVGLSSSAQEGMSVFDLERVSTFRAGMASTANSGFAHDVDISTPAGALAFLPLGIVTLLFSPFPWQMTSLRALFAAPETILWWTLFPSLVRGVRYVIARRFAECSPIILFTVALLPAYSLVHGNIGSGFRQRAQIFVFLFIFTSLGQYVKKARRRHLDEGLLLANVEPAPALETGT
jgi:4-amino-4-deoxy-L-arabinose transferase-like glycosyltransferase